MTADTEGRSRRYHDAELTRAARRNRVLYVLTILAGVVYLSWLISVTDWSHPVAAGMFLLAELICFVCVLVWGDMLSEQRLHPPEGMEWKGDLPDVDLLITVCREPMEVVRPAFEAAARIDYPRLQVTVLDDGTTLVRNRSLLENRTTCSIDPPSAVFSAAAIGAGSGRPVTWLGATSATSAGDTP